MDIAIINTLLITFRGNKLGIIEDGAVGIEGSEIKFVGKTYEIDYKKADKVIDGSSHVTMPGLVNAHTHTGLTLLRGGAQDVPEIEWMNKALAPLANHMTKDDFILGSKLGVIEGLRNGITTFGEYTSNIDETIEEVYRQFNVRVAATKTINEVVSKKEELGLYDLYELDEEKGIKDLMRSNELFDKYKDYELVDFLYGPQAADMVSLSTLDKIFEEAKERAVKIHMHIAQGGRERLQIKRRYGRDMTTVKVLKKHNLLPDNLIAVHCHDTNRKERKILAENRISMIGCPNSISMIDGLITPVADFLHFGCDVGLGTDQAPGPGTHNLFREMRIASILSKIKYIDPTQLPAWEVLKLGSMGGAKVLGLNDKIGSIEEGKKADIVTLDISKPNIVPVVSNPFNTIVPNLVYSTTGLEVDNVIINGELILQNNDFVNIDERNVLQESEKRANEIYTKAIDDWEESNSHLVQMKKKGII
ncbi:MAG: amidohydrolase family protein [Thermoplasmatota archaeon]